MRGVPVELGGAVDVRRVWQLMASFIPAGIGGASEGVVKYYMTVVVVVVPGVVC